MPELPQIVKTVRQGGLLNICSVEFDPATGLAVPLIKPTGDIWVLDNFRH